MRKLTFPLALIALVAVLAGPAHAGKPAGVSGSITLDTGGISTSAAPSTVPTLKYGGEAHFKATVQGRLASGSTIYVTVVCTQGSTVVYQWSADESFSFPLADQAGQGLEWDGNAARLLRFTRLSAAEWEERHHQLPRHHGLQGRLSRLKPRPQDSGRGSVSQAHPPDD